MPCHVPSREVSSEENDEGLMLRERKEGASKERQFPLRMLILVSDLSFFQFCFSCCPPTNLALSFPSVFSCVTKRRKYLANGCDEEKGLAGSDQRVCEEEREVACFRIFVLLVVVVVLLMRPLLLFNTDVTTSSRPLATHCRCCRGRFPGRSGGGIATSIQTAPNSDR